MVPATLVIWKILQNVEINFGHPAIIYPHKELEIWNPSKKNSDREREGEGDRKGEGKGEREQEQETSDVINNMWWCLLPKKIFFSNKIYIYCNYFTF